MCPGISKRGSQGHPGPAKAGEGIVGLKAFGPRNGWGAGSSQQKLCSERNADLSRAQRAGRRELRPEEHPPPPPPSPECLPLATPSQKPEGKEPIDIRKAQPPPGAQINLEKGGAWIWAKRMENQRHSWGKRGSAFS